MITSVSDARPESANLTDDQRASILHSKALWNEAYAIAAANPGVDPGDVYHALRALELTPLERVIVSKRAANRPKDSAQIPMLEAALAARTARGKTSD